MNVRWLNESPASSQLVGGKAYIISKLGMLGFATAAGFVITVDAFELFLEANGLANIFHGLSDYRSPSKLANMLLRLEQGIEAATWPENLRASIVPAYDKLGGPVTIRSSGVMEDSKISSFAGAYSSFLNRSGSHDVLRAVRECWKSGFSARVAAYRLEHGLARSKWLMAVLVQRMVFAEKSGVIFTLDPFSNDNSMLIEAVLGGCDRLVAGRPADLRLRIDRGTRAVLSSEGQPAGSTHFGSGAAALLQGSPSPNPKLLRRAEIEQLIELGLKVEQSIGEPQDIEWALAGGTLTVLQARSLTAYQRRSRSA